MKTRAKTTPLLALIGVAAALLVCCGSLRADPVIYEPFAGVAGSLGGEVGGTGLSGNWTLRNGTVTVSNSSLSYATLPLSGNKATLIAVGGNGGAASVAIGSALNDAGLLASGQTLWFSYLLSSGSGSANNHAGFGFGTSYLNSGANGPTMNASGNGLGVHIYKDAQVRAASWSSGVLTEEAKTTGMTAGSTRLIVGKIQWGVPTILTLYMPGTDLALPAVQSSITNAAGLAGTTFNTVSICLRADAGANQTYDEIRFGATYQDVIGASPTNSYWDLNGATAGAGSATPSGTWNAANPFWNVAVDGTGSTNAWPPGGTAVFAAGTDATGTYTVTVSGTQDIGGLIFEEGTVTVGGGTALRLVANSLVNVASGGAATLATPLWEGGGARQMNKAGLGTLVLSGTNTYTGGTVVSGGTLRLTSAAGLSTSTSVYLSTGGGTLDLAFTGTNQVTALYINGAKQTNGLYGATTTPITGTGYLAVGVLDTDGDGIPDWWTIQYFSHPTGLASDSSRAQDDADGDGLTNLQEYQLGTNPLKADTDGDGLSDGAEVNNYHTNPLLADTDGDGLSDGAEVNTYHTNPLLADTDGDGLSDGAEVNMYHTNPLKADTDGDGASDWYEVTASFTSPTNSADKPVIPYPLPKPNSTLPATNKPVKVFILSGQSNMVGMADVDPTNTPGTLATMAKQQGKFPNLLDTNGNWWARSNVMYRGVIAATGNAPLQQGQGSDSAHLGPELGFGQVMGYYFDEPVLLIKSSQGGRALGWDFLPPGSQRYTNGTTVYAGYGDSPASWTVGTTPVPTSFYGGYQYDQCFLRKADWAPAGATNAAVFNVTDVLDHFATEYPRYAAQGFEIAGFVWWQGWNDGMSYTAFYANRYETNLVNFIKQIRSYYESRYPGKIKSNAPFVLATCGFQGWSNPYPTRQAVANAQIAVSDQAKHPEFAGNVKTMESRSYWRDASSSPMDQEYHYNHNAETYMLVGDALGRGMIGLLQGADYSAWAALWPGANLSDPNADPDGDGLSNDYERIWGLNPTNAASRNPFPSSAGLAAGTFRYTRRAVALSGLAYTVWTSTNLTTWAQDTGAVQTPGTPVADVETVTVNLSPTLLSQPRLFVRMRAGQ